MHRGPPIWRHSPRGSRALKRVSVMSPSRGRATARQTGVPPSASRRPPRPPTGCSSPGRAAARPSCSRDGASRAAGRGNACAVRRVLRADGRGALAVCGPTRARSRDASCRRRQTIPCAQPYVGCFTPKDVMPIQLGRSVGWMRGLRSGSGRITVAGLSRDYLREEDGRTFWDFKLSSALVDVGCSYGACHALFCPFWL